MIGWSSRVRKSEYPPVRIGDQMTISHADAGYRTLVAALKEERVTTATAREPLLNTVIVRKSSLMQILSNMFDQNIDG